MSRYDFGAIKSQLDLASVMEECGVQLIRTGTKTMCLCPFHSERTASMYIYPDGHYHCFGCGAHGDVINAYAKLRNVSLGEAARTLSERLSKPSAPPTLRKVQAASAARDYRKLSMEHAIQNVIDAFNDWQALKLDAMEAEVKDLTRQMLALDQSHATPLETANDPKLEELATRQGQLIVARDDLAVADFPSILKVMLDDLHEICTVHVKAS